MAQSSPTCSNPHFLIGVPGCTTVDKVLFTASVKAGSAGTASIGLTGVDIIGEGVSVGSASISGNYTINAVPKSTTAPAPTPAPTPTTENVTTTPEAQPAQPAVTENISTPSFLATVFNFSTFGKSVRTTIIIIIIVFVIYSFIMLLKKKGKKDEIQK